MGENTVLTFEAETIIPWALYFAFTLVLIVVMLNLLIAIISDEFDRVQASRKSTDLRAKCEILKEYGEIR